ncbi:MAG TPA: hypothetical protein VK172_12050, partial [Lentimicrobium sp.]|nr:hypothetical protein [Lentimicrobium sp.]
MKKNLISLASILSAILLFSITAGAQITNNYNLSGYKLPDYRYRQLETQFSLSGADNSYKIDEQKLLDRYIAGDAGATYYSYMNSRKTQRSQYFGANFDGNSSHRDNANGINDYSDFNSSLHYSINNKRYFPNKLFLATGVYAS